MQRQRSVQTIASPALTQREVEFAKAAWSAGLRPDQRKAQQLREVVINFPLLSRDVSYVHCGGTVVTAAVSCELVDPHPHRPKHGLMEFSVRQLHTERDDASKGADLKKLASFLERLIKVGGVVDMESLCVLPGKRVWSISIDITVLNDEGNTTDAAVWAAMAALLHYRRPELTIRGNSITVHPAHERDPVPLSVHHTPLSFTFAITMSFSERQKKHRRAKNNDNNAPSSNTALDVVVDPTVTEALAAASSAVVAINAEGQVCAVLKSEGCCIGAAELNQCITTASELAPCVLDLIRAAMTAHDAKRQEALKGQFLWAQKRAGVGMADAEAQKKMKKEV